MFAGIWSAGGKYLTISTIDTGRARVAARPGFTGIEAGAVEIARILFFVFRTPSAPVPAPVSTDHYAGAAGNPFEPVTI